MGEAHVAHIGHELVGEFVIGEERAVIVPPPRAEMDLIDRDRPAARVARAATAQIGLVMPMKGVGSATREAVLGRISEAKANGSALSGSNVPPWPLISNL